MSKLRILVADDDPPNRYLLEQRLTSLGYSVVCCSDGREALEYVRRERVDVIVSDALMPRMDGFQLCGALKAEAQLSAIPFIFFTATYTEEADEQLARRVGASAFLVKPDEAERLPAAIEQAVAEARAGRAPGAAGGFDPSVIEQYAQRVALKLEAKITELERANSELLRAEHSVRELNEKLNATIVRLEREISERRHSEELLHLAQSVGELASWGVEFGADTAWFTTDAARMFGFAAGAAPLSVTAVLDAVAPADRPQLAVLADPDRRREADLDAEVRVPLPGGEHRILHLRSVVFRDAAARPVRRIGTVQDVTQRRRAEAKQRELEERLRQSQKMEAIGNLAGGIAHDFNNILTAVLAHAEMLTIDLPGTPAFQTHRESAREIVGASHRARDLVNQILAFSRKQPVEKKPVELCTVVTEALRLVRSTLPAGVRLQADLRGDGRSVNANASQLHQVVLNLCNNAAHAIGPRGGTVAVTIEPVAVDEAYAAAHPPLHAGEHLRLTVGDDGCGMDDATVKRVFEPFFTTKPVGQGTGLGLAVVHGIVQSHDGAITVESRPGAGTAFAILLPVRAAAAANAAKAMQVPTAGVSRRVLVVDDEPSVARSTVKLLTRLGYHAEAVHEPEQARRKLFAEPGAFDLVLSDYAMPGMTGIVFARSVWAEQPDQRFILMAGFGGNLDRKRAIAEGFRDFLAKPFTVQALADACTGALA